MLNKIAGFLFVVLVVFGLSVAGLVAAGAISPKLFVLLLLGALFVTQPVFIVASVLAPSAFTDDAHPSD